MTRKKSDDTPLRPTGDMLTAHLLALLKGWSAYGYELTQRLEESGFGDFNKGSVYRALRQMEKSGLVASMWDTSEKGPARRMYRLTQLGTAFLGNWLAVLDAHRQVLDSMLKTTGGETEDAAPAAKHPESRRSKSS
jgi:poly-beta-hydroxybutyrate-responsive repressor